MSHMRQVIILTKNVLFEEELQKRLQRLDFEVFCSSCSDHWLEERWELTIFNHFQAVILSETFCDQEVRAMLLRLEKQSVRIFRVVENKPNEKRAEAWRRQGIDGWIEKSDCLDRLRETLVTTPSQRIAERLPEGEVETVAVNDSVRWWQLENALATFSKTEKLVFKYLVEGQAQKRVVTREELCHKVWHSEETPSTTSQLSTIIGKLRTKLSKHGIPGNTILTLWGKGYRFSVTFYDQWLTLAQPNYGVIIRTQSVAQSL